MKLSMIDLDLQFQDSIDWHRGDKWRDSDQPAEREAWEKRQRKLLKQKAELKNMVLMEKHHVQNLFSAAAILEASSSIMDRREGAALKKLAESLS